jgi:hypothetical protein
MSDDAAPATQPDVGTSVSVLAPDEAQQDPFPQGPYDRQQDDQAGEAGQQEMRRMQHQDESAEPKARRAGTSGKSREKIVRLSVNLSSETATMFKALIERKGLSITEGIRRAIAIWKFLEDQKDQGNEIAIIEPDDTVRKVVLL